NQCGRRAASCSPRILGPQGRMRAMSKKLPILRVAWPTLTVSLILFAACTASAIFLYRIHAHTAEGLAEDIDSRRVAGRIETTRRNLITLIKSGSDQVAALHEDIERLIDEARDLANTETESELELKLEQSFARYKELWDQRGEAADPQGTVQAALKVLASET